MICAAPWRASWSTAATGAAVRLETARDCPREMINFLLQQFALDDVDLYRMPGPVNLNACRRCTI